MRPLAPFSVVIKPSRRLLLIQVLAHLTAIGAVFAASIPSWLTVVLLLLTGASLARVRHRSVVAKLVLGGDGQLELVGADGTVSQILVHPQTLVLSFLIVLVYRLEGRLQSLTLLGDSLATREDFRCLRLWLRWRSITAQTG